MRTRHIVIAALGLVLLQAAVAPRVALGRIQPDFLVVLVVLVALRRGEIAGSVTGFAMGLARDLSNPSLLGLNALVGSLVGWTCGRVARQAVPDSRFFRMLMAALAVWLHDAIYLLVFHGTHVGTALAGIFTVALGSALYTLVAAGAVEPVIAWIRRMESGHGQAG